MFVDTVKIQVHAGKGGGGSLSFRHEKFVDKGGPDGGDGGNGGSIVTRADHNLNTLSAFRHSPLIKAKDGDNGRHRRQHGKSGEDQYIVVPVGTTISEDSAVVADLTEHGQETVVAKGGRGGFGNAHFTSSIRQTPDFSEIGEPGEQKHLSLELKLIADVGLIGLPNAGKSTFLSVVSNAKPAIADYPFTTLRPHLGVVDVDESSVLMADIPGLIEGASKGKGLGDEFLRHIERTSILLHLIDATEVDIATSYQTIMSELKSYKVNLTKKPQIVVLTKIDILDSKTLGNKQAALREVTKAPTFAISAVAHQNVRELLRATLKLVDKTLKKAKKSQPAAEEIPVITLADDPNAWWVEKTRRGYCVKGRKIEGFARRTNLAQAQGEARLRDIMHKMGIDRELIRLGIGMGNTITIATKKFKW